MPALDPLLHHLLRGLLSFVLLRAAWHKGRDLPAFRRALADYALLPRRAVPAAALALLACEATTATALWGPTTGTTAAWAAAGLLVLYSAAIAINLARGRGRIDCGCSGPAGARPLGGGLLLRNGALIGLALVAVAPVATRPLSALDAFSLVCGVAVAALLYLAVDLALALAPRLHALRSRP
jgi:hypothetical protein